MKLARCIRPNGDEWNLPVRKVRQVMEIRLPQTEPGLRGRRWFRLTNMEGILYIGGFAFTRVFIPSKEAK